MICFSRLTLGRECKLWLNVATTKVVVFRARKVGQFSLFRLAGDVIEIAYQYTYLGITLSCDGKFEVHEELLKRRVAAASVSLSQIIANLPDTNMNLSRTLFNSKVISIAMYGVEIWSLSSLDGILQLQEQFFKKLFHLYITTPGYVLRHQFQL